MKKHFLTGLSLLLLAAMLASFVSCGADETAGNPGQAADGSTAVTAEAAETTEAETTRKPLEVPRKDYEGYVFRILEYTQTEIGQRQFLDFGWSKEASGDLINDAVYARNMVVEDHYNITVDSIQNDDVAAAAKKSVMAGTDDYDVAMSYINKSFPLAQDGLLINLYDVPQLNLANEWWDQAAIRDIAIGGKMYAATGDITMADEELNYCIFANKTVWKEYEVADLYQLAREGKWTLEAMSEASRDVTHDLNGDGVLDENDVYGILTSTTVASVWFISVGGRMAELDANGAPTLVLNSEKNVERIEKLHDLFTDTNLVLDATNCSNQWKTCNTMLMEDRALFRVGSVYNIQQYRGMINDFGILPYPKLDEQQDDYHHLIATQVCAAVSVPTTSVDPERTGILLEALAYESKDTVMKAYYDVNLYTKVTRDEESGEMFDIIFSSKCYDICKVFGWGGLEAMINESVKTNSFASAYAAKEASALAAMEKTYAYFAS